MTTGCFHYEITLTYHYFCFSKVNATTNATISYLSVTQISWSVNFRFKKIEEIIPIHEKTHVKDDERFQSVYPEAVI